MNSIDRRTSTIDDEGNLLGVINVVDALVGVLVLAVGVAGVGLLLTGGLFGDNASTTYVTLDLGNQPEYVVSALNEGDNYDPGGESNLTITDLYFAPSGDGASQGNQTRVFARAELEGVPNEEFQPTNGNTTIEYAGAPPRLGRTLQISTQEYDVSGRISAVGGGSGLDTGTTTVVLRQRVSVDEASAITLGDEIGIGGRTAATVEDVAAYPTSNADEQVVLIEANLSSHTQEGTPRFGGTALRPGQQVRLPTAEYNINGRIERVGSGLETGTTTVLLEDTVSAADASEITAGDEINAASYRAATVEDVAVYPTTNPDERRILVEANVSSYVQQGAQRFGGTALRRDQQVTLRTDDYTIDGRIQGVGSSLRDRELTNRTVTLELSEVREEKANSLRPGQTEQAGTVPTAYVTDVDVEPTPIISTAEDGSVVVSDHPRLRDVTLTTELRVTETNGAVEFRGERIQLGSTVVLDLGVVTVQTEVVDIGR